MDTAKIINDLVAKLTSDEGQLESFKKNATETVKKLIHVDLPDDALDTVVLAVKAKLMKGSAADVVGQLGGLFDKK